MGNESHFSLFENLEFNLRIKWLRLLYKYTHISFYIWSRFFRKYDKTLYIILYTLLDFQIYVGAEKLMGNVLNMNIINYI